MTKHGLETVVGRIKQTSNFRPLTVTLRSGERVFGSLEEIASEILVLKHEDEQHFVTIEAIDVVTCYSDSEQLPITLTKP